MRKLMYATTIAVLSIGVAACGASVNDDGSVKIDINTTATGFDLYNSYTMAGGSYLEINVKGDSGRSQRELPYTLLPSLSSGVPQATVTVGDTKTESTVLKAEAKPNAFDNGRVEFVFLNGNTPEDNLKLNLKIGSFEKQIPLNIISDANWVPVQSLAVNDPAGNAVSSVDGSADAVQVVVAGGDNHDAVDESGKFEFDFGNGGTTSNPDVSVVNDNPDAFKVKLFYKVEGESGGYYLLILPNAAGESATLKIESVGKAADGTRKRTTLKLESIAATP